jgi:hypothetical protein
MPGRAISARALAAGYDRIAVTCADHPTGAELVSTTDDPALVEAVHAWFERELLSALRALD